MGSSPTAPTPSWQAEDLRLAATEALARDGHLLSAGELLVLRRLLGCPPELLTLYARLHGRRTLDVRLDALAGPELPDPLAAAEALVREGLAWSGARHLPLADLLETCTVEELRALLRARGLPTVGRRGELLARLLGSPPPRAALPDCLRLRHRGLLDRLIRLYLGSSRADLQRMVLHRLGILRYPRYEPGPGPGLFPHRRSLRNWEDSLAVDARLAALPQGERAAALIARLDLDLDLATAGPPPEDWRRRRTARHLATQRAVEALGHLEREDPPAAARGLRWLVRARPELEGPLLPRLIAVLEALGEEPLALQLAIEAMGRVDPLARIGLVRTARRLGRRQRRSFPPPPALRRAPERHLRMPLVESPGPRPLWRTRRGDLPIERAVIQTLAEAGREAVHAEGLLWTTLLGLLFRDALFAPLPGVLSTPWRTGPLDLGCPGFRARREPLIGRRLEELEAGAGPGRLLQTWDQHHGEAISGVSWALAPREVLARVCRELGGRALRAILEPLLDGANAAGLPDLVILAGPPGHLPLSFPSRLPDSAFLAELKGPTDSLRDPQRLWLDQLLQARVPVELWWVAASPTGRGDPPASGDVIPPLPHDPHDQEPP